MVRFLFQCRDLTRNRCRAGRTRESVLGGKPEPTVILDPRVRLREFLPPRVLTAKQQAALGNCQESVTHKRTLRGEMCMYGARREGKSPHRDPGRCAPKFRRQYAKALKLFSRQEFRNEVGELLVTTSEGGIGTAVLFWGRWKHSDR